MTTKSDVRKAIRHYLDGARPVNFRAPKSWYLREGTELFPLKAIWALVHDVRPGSFNTSDAIAGVERLGFETVRDEHVDLEKSQSDFDDAVARAMADSSDNRRARLKSAPKKARAYKQVVRVFVRNPDVVAEALFLAKGRCERCLAKAPFTRRSNGEPFLEVHHVVPLADGGDDSLENVMALCPNCHRFEHHG